MKFRTRNLLFSMLAAILAAGMLFVFLGAVEQPAVVRAEYNIVTQEPLQSEYDLDTQFTVPALVAEVDGVEVAANGILHYPDGRVMQREVHLLDKTGEYTIEYTIRSEAGALIDTIEKTFVVREPLYTLSGAGSTAEYVSDSSQLLYPDLGTGLRVSLYTGTWITFNETVDMTALGDESPVSLYIVPRETGTNDFGRLVVRLIDVQDENNYVTFHLNAVAGKTYSNAQAGCAWQTVSGRERWSSAEYGDVNKLYVGGTGGQPVDFSFNGNNTTNNYRLLHLRIDADMQVYVQNKLVIDLNASEDFDEPWTGWTSGKVKVAVSAEILDATTADFVVTGLHGVDLSTEKVTEDITGPAIDVDMLGYSADALPQASVGRPYRLFEASADASARPGSLKTRVYYNYNDPQIRLDIPVENSSFVPEWPGMYTIVYTAEDDFGIETKLKLNVVCARTDAEIIVSAPNERVTKGTVGIPVPVNTNFTAIGGSGALNTDVSVWLSGKSIPLQDGSFMPEEEGLYDVVYSATDYNGKVGMEIYTVDIKFSELPIFVSDPALLPYYIAGATYKLPSYSAYDYKNDSEIQAGLTLTLDGEPVDVSDGVFVAETTNKTAVLVFTYTAGGAEKKIERTVYNMKDAEGNFDLSIPFALNGGANIETVSDSGAILLTAEESGSFTYVHYLLAEGSQIVLRSVPDRIGFGAAEILFTDRDDPSLSVTVKLTNNGEAGATASIGGNRVALSRAFGQEGNDFTVGYASGFTVNNTAIAASSYDDGRTFEGFPSGYVYISVRFTDVIGDSALELRSISRQRFSMSTVSDSGTPSMALSGALGGYYEIGDMVEIPAAYAADVLQPNVTFTVTVTAPDGSTMSAIDGTSLLNADPSNVYGIQLSLYGNYEIHYALTDGQRSYQISYWVRVRQETDPVFTVSENYKTSVSAGGVVDIASVSAATPEGEAVSVTVMVMDPRGSWQTVSDGQFTAHYAGEYKIWYTARDDNGNVSQFYYTVTAE